MKTLDEALAKLEWFCGGSYGSKISFPNSELRTNTEETALFLKGQFENLSKCKGAKTIDTCIESIESFVAGPENIGKSDFRDERRSYHVTEAIECCDIILTRLAESKPVDGRKLTVDDLNNKYRGKFLIFNGDEDGTQIVFVEDIHYYDNELSVDGVMIDLCNENHESGDGILIYEIDDRSFDSGFWYFGEFEDPENTDELDQALQSQPCDTSYPTHVISAKEVVSYIIGSIRWTVDEKICDVKLTHFFNQLEAVLGKLEE